MKARFSGATGRPALIDSLLQQRLVQHDRGVAEKLADTGVLVEFSPGDTIITQGETDTDVFFILHGEAAVSVNNRQVETRGPREVVGEMVAVDPTARRSATLKAKSPLLCLKVPAADFVAAGDGSPSFWRVMAQVTGDRLRQRERFHRPANELPVMFVGSSVEGLPVVQELEQAFKHDKIVLRPWTKGVFGPSGFPLEDLLAAVETADFALFVFGLDDKIASRGKDYEAPRDNVILEMGLFLGRLGRERVLMLKDHASDLKIPSDLLGVTPVTYVLKTGCDLGSALGAATNEIRKAVRKLGAL